MEKIRLGVFNDSADYWRVFGRQFPVLKEGESWWLSWSPLCLSRRSSSGHQIPRIGRSVLHRVGYVTFLWLSGY